MAVPLSGARARPSDLPDGLVAGLPSQQIGQEVGFSVETSDSGTFTAETQIASVSFTEVAGWVYYIETIAQLASGTVTDIVQATLRENTSGGTERASGRCAAQTSDQARPVGIGLAYRYVATASGSKTFVLTGQRTSGGGNVKREAGTTHPLLMTVRRVD